LRHIPLFLIREMARHKTHRHLVGELLLKVITRADMLADFLALYWAEGKQPLSNQVRKGLAAAFQRFDEYALAKNDRSHAAIALRDVLFLVRPKPKDEEQAELWKRLSNKQLATPDTWEVALSSGQDKKGSWERLLKDNKLGALAFLRNLRNMEDVEVDRGLIQHGFDTIRSGMLLPLNFFAAAKHAPQWMREIETMMLANYQQLPKLAGWTVFVVDVSGSMNGKISEKSDFDRLDAANAMVVLASECCEKITVYATGGNDGTRVHATKVIPNYRGFALAEEIKRDRLGNGGIFTRQCLEFIRDHQKGRIPDRMIIFSDSQDCDLDTSKKPDPFGSKNYIIDVSAHQHGINYAGIWTAEVSGWSEHFLNYIAALEGLNYELL
jgi:60 kDa SS-A/Ro ribonucleoprotein